MGYTIDDKWVDDGTSLAPKVSTRGVSITNSGTGNGLFLDQDGNGIALEIDSEATTAANYGLSVTTGAGAYCANFTAEANNLCILGRAASGTNASHWFFRNLASGSTAVPVVLIEQDNDGDDQVALVIQQDADNIPALALTGAGASIAFAEINSAPTAIGSSGQLYTKSDDDLYFQDGAGVEKVVMTDAPRVVTTATDTTAVIDVGVTDVYELTGMDGATTFSFTGTPKDGQKILVRAKDDGTTRALTWTGFTAIGVTLPTDSTAGKWHYVLAVYNLGATAYHAIAASTEA